MAPTPPMPPRVGPGSSTEAWLAHVTGDLGLGAPADAKRDDLIAIAEARHAELAQSGDPSDEGPPPADSNPDTPADTRVDGDDPSSQVSAGSGPDTPADTEQDPPSPPDDAAGDAAGIGDATAEDEGGDAAMVPVGTMIAVRRDAKVNYHGQLVRLEAGEILHGSLRRFVLETAPDLVEEPVVSVGRDDLRVPAGD